MFITVYIKVRFPYSYFVPLSLYTHRNFHASIGTSTLNMEIISTSETRENICHNIRCHTQEDNSWFPCDSISARIRAAMKFEICFGRFSVRISAGKPSVMTKVLVGFLSPSRRNAEIVPRSAQYRSLKIFYNPKFISHPTYQHYIVWLESASSNDAFTSGK
jgi:hypothetical protein